MTPEGTPTVLLPQPANSIAISLNAKGLYQLEAKVYFPDGDEGRAMATLAAIEADFRSRFPHPALALPQASE